MRQPAFCCFFASSKYASDLKRCTWWKVSGPLMHPNDWKTSGLLQTFFSTIIARNWFLSTSNDLDIFVSVEGPDHPQGSGDGHQDIGHRVTTFPCLYYTTPRLGCQPNAGCWSVGWTTPFPRPWVQRNDYGSQPHQISFASVLRSNHLLVWLCAILSFYLLYTL